MFKFTASDAKRLDLTLRRLWIDQYGDFEIWNSLDISVWGDVGSPVSGDYRYWDPDEIEDSLGRSCAYSVEYGYDVFCYYRGNPDYIIIDNDGVFLEYHSGKNLLNFNPKTYVGYLLTEEVEKIISDLPKWHYWVVGNPDFDIKILYK